jgi:hypothetical protein
MRLSEGLESCTFLELDCSENMATAFDDRQITTTKFGACRDIKKMKQSRLFNERLILQRTQYPPKYLAKVD